MSRLPVWMNLRNVPLELFTQNGISYIASALGKPLYMDRFTAGQQRLAFARVCVEIEATKEIPKMIDVQLRNGAIVQISVDIPWMPIRCAHCAIFGHEDKTCTKKTGIVQVWVPKQKGAKDDKKDQVEIADTTDEKQSQSEHTNDGGIMEALKEIPKKDEMDQQLEIAVKSPALSTVMKSGKSGSVNRFEILDSILDNDDGKIEINTAVLNPRQTRAASAGVADLMKTLKPKRKGSGDKVRNKASTSSMSLNSL